jgi:hypothetical protein
MCRQTMWSHFLNPPMNLENIPFKVWMAKEC